MIVRIFKRRNRGGSSALIEPDEIFLDSKNIQNFNIQQFEGRIEKPISKRTIFVLAALFGFFVLIFFAQLGNLQIRQGQAYMDRSENNTMERVLLFADRGIIYDRNKVELAWNKKDEDAGEEFGMRAYKFPGFGHILGYVGYPAKDKQGNYWQENFLGKDGLEKEYNDLLAGKNGSKMTETDAREVIQSENIVNAPKRGKDLIITVDSRIQGELYKLIKEATEGYSFTGGAGVIIDTTNGEVIASTSYPEYNPEILSLGKNKPVIDGYISDKRKVFLDRTISGLYTPGSIVKPFLALGALAEGIIDPHKQILSTGSISVPNPYYPDQKTVFKDWRANGWTDMRQAIAVSSDVYFYSIGGGYQDQKGLGILNIEKYARLFGIGETTGVDLPDERSGVIPSPEWKIKNFNGDPWRIGDTYHTAIGQYGFQVTPMEMARAAAAIANGGELLVPHFVLGDKSKEEQVSQIDMPEENFQIVREGMRAAVTMGTAGSLYAPYVNVAVKTGTAQVGINKNKVNSWVMGFLPYENPKYAFVIMMEGGPTTNSVNASSVMRQLLDWMAVYTPGYLN